MRNFKYEEEVCYIYSNFKITYTENCIDKTTHDTVIYVYADFREMQQQFKLFGQELYGAGMIKHSEYQIEFDGLRFLFKYGDKVLSGGLRGYDKRKTLIINRGGL